MNKEKDVKFRVSLDMKKRLEAVLEKVGLTESGLMRIGAEALIEHIEKNGEICLPLAIVPKKSLKQTASNSSR